MRWCPRRTPGERHALRRRAGPAVTWRRPALDRHEHGPGPASSTADPRTRHCWPIARHCGCADGETGPPVAAPAELRGASRSRDQRPASSAPVPLRRGRSCGRSLTAVTKREWLGPGARAEAGGCVVATNHISHFDPLSWRTSSTTPAGLPGSWPRPGCSTFRSSAGSPRRRADPGLPRDARRRAGVRARGDAVNAGRVRRRSTRRGR